MDNFPEHFGLDTFYRLLINGWIVDGRAGGLITGRTHDTGHIIMITPIGDPVNFRLCGLVAGGEYLVSTNATAQHHERLQHINSDKSPCHFAITLNAESRMINTRAEPHDKLLLVANQFVINAEATKRHFDELERINASCPSTNGIVFTEDESKQIAAIDIFSAIKS